ncbi:MAG: single-stranded DNA-binding protein [Clostridium sp.]|uniref:single-stranded DNA-binding protein n=1 Tax=Clostridium sp. TaxID=1506 RepID=UPI002911F575|nr:single-stranded DNA-binding protein [Clostridium sp.]MDU5108874.1 single-stranded DNA-binding protein [Clostridium sp.]
MNKVILIGRLTKDSELNFTAGSGAAVCRFSMAVARPFKKGETDFINCVAFGKTGETIAQYFTKGKPIAITGSIRTGSYDAKDGTKRYTTDVVVESFEFIGQGKQEQKEDNPFNNGGMNFEEDMTPVDDGDMPF